MNKPLSCTFYPSILKIGQANSVRYFPWMGTMVSKSMYTMKSSIFVIIIFSEMEYLLSIEQLQKVIKVLAINDPFMIKWQTNNVIADQSQC